MSVWAADRPQSLRASSLFLESKSPTFNFIKTETDHVICSQQFGQEHVEHCQLLTTSF